METEQKRLCMHPHKTPPHLIFRNGGEEVQMERHIPEVVGVRRTGWAALERDPQKDIVEFTCPHCGAKGQKKARHERAEYRFTDGFLQDLQGEGVQCHFCKQSMRVVPIVLVHDGDEVKRFEAVFSEEPELVAKS
jgi:hypothetical protein